MRTTFSRIREHGTVLVTTLVIALLVGIAVGALMIIAQQQHYLTARSTVWNSEIPTAEAGIEEAMAHLNSKSTNLATHGWTKTPTNYWTQRTNGLDYYYTVITTSSPPAIISVGYGRIPLQTTFTRRTIVVRTKLAPPGWGIAAKNNISMNGSVSVDSFDSSDRQFSDTNGNYVLAKRRDRAGVATTSTNLVAIDTGGALVYGSVATGPHGTAVGSVGDGTWLSSGQTTVQPGHFTDDFNMAITDVKLPPELLGATLPLPGSIGLTLYTYLLGNGDYTLPLGLTLGGTMVVTGKARLYVNGATKITGSGSGITITKGGSLEIYLNGDLDVGGGGIVNGTQVASACAIYGLPTCTSFKYSGNAELHAKIYVPQALLEMVGTTDFSGSVVANSISFKGTPNIHYDEALGANPDYRIASWEEQ